MDRNIIFFGNSVAADAVTSAQMKEIERAADAEGLSYYQMMENAGSGAAEIVALDQPVSGKKVLILCGKGNNGGDGFVVARKLVKQGAQVRLVLVEGDPRTKDAIKNLELCEVNNIPMTDLQKNSSTARTADTNLTDLIEMTADADIVVDAIYGTGFRGLLREPAKSAARIINKSKAVVYALDIPSGLNCDTGDADADTVRADFTIAFHRLKPAHIEDKCADYCGNVVCISIGIE